MMETKEGVNLKSIETEELLRELRMRDDVVISSWSIDDIATEIEYQAHRQGIEIDNEAPVIELAALALRELADRLESAMIETSFEIVVNKCDDILDNLHETGWITNYPLTTTE